MLYKRSKIVLRSHQVKSLTTSFNSIFPVTLKIARKFTLKVDSTESDSALPIL